jgi:hypothetical protein
MCALLSFDQIMTKLREGEPDAVRMAVAARIWIEGSDATSWVSVHDLRQLVDAVINIANGVGDRDDLRQYARQTAARQLFLKLCYRFKTDLVCAQQLRDCVKSLANDMLNDAAHHGDWASEIRYLWIKVKEFDGDCLLSGLIYAEEALFFAQHDLVDEIPDEDANAMIQGFYTLPE